MTKTKQPNSKMCFVCGLDNPVGLKLHIYQTEPGVIETTYIAPDYFQGYPGVLHGGIVATILDEISGRAHMGDPSEPRFMYTGKMEVKYRKNVPIGIPLKIIGKAGKMKKRTAEGWAGIYHPDGTLLAEASALLFNVPEEMLASTDLDALGWKIYPDEE
ncbi:MAG: PaaI family thioesterase [Anaerolineae bacterium]|jgi:acyl-coenzyme A thioesterase PaaI-like protein|nr:PaaI family thioesterase [Anaerolineae bacterium]MBT3712296.1 PaaI family thioesterase [Anaerolineae bacterium]MBT4309857.1 PaaI family thioesterase [Anaerolineae bacterium]MBT4457528.1 PaaI family thioesterase [Anaerolineae bacterium]MBT4843607.1 PaaI family thioesterase [Anaerolineae bacterium]